MHPPPRKRFFLEVFFTSPPPSDLVRFGGKYLPVPPQPHFGKNLAPPLDNYPKIGVFFLHLLPSCVLKKIKITAGRWFFGLSLIYDYPLFLISKKKRSERWYFGNFYRGTCTTIEGYCRQAVKAQLLFRWKALQLWIQSLTCYFPRNYPRPLVNAHLCDETSKIHFHPLFKVKIKWVLLQLDILSFWQNLTRRTCTRLILSSSC